MDNCGLPSKVISHARMRRLRSSPAPIILIDRKRSGSTTAQYGKLPSPEGDSLKPYPGIHRRSTGSEFIGVAYYLQD